MIAFDASFLILAFDKNASKDVQVAERIALLLEELSNTRTKLLVPTPALSEFLAKSDISVLDEISNSAAFRIGSFDERAAIEAADLTKRSLKESDKKDPIVNATWAKIKFDRQIVAIAKVEGCDAIYSTDPDIAKHAKQVGMKCYSIADLPMPNPQPLLPGINSDDEGNTAIEPASADFHRSGSGYPESEAGAEDAKGKNQDAGSEKKE